MKLYLMRHGEALSPQVDPERGLTEKGKERIVLVAEHLLNKGVTFEHIFHSKKKRARETAEIMQNIISPGTPLNLHSHIKPEDDPNIISAEISTWHEDTLITSHLPFVPNLMTLLTDRDAYLSPITFETGTFVCLEKVSSFEWAYRWSTCPSEII